MGNQLRSCYKNEDKIIPNKYKDNNNYDNSYNEGSNENSSTGANHFTNDNINIKEFFESLSKDEALSNFIDTSFEPNNNNFYSDINNDNFFFICDNCHMNKNFNVHKCFNKYNNSILNTKLEKFMLKEEKKLKKEFLHINFQIEAIVERDYNYRKENLMNNSSSYSSTVSASSLNNSLSTHFKFIIITNIMIYDLEFLFSNNELNLRRKICLKDICFISLSSENNKFIIHVEQGKNLYIFNEQSEQICFCLCYSAYKNLAKKVIKVVPIPQTITFFDIIRKCHKFEDYSKLYNDYVEKLTTTLKSNLLLDENEKILKFVPVQKIENKYLDNKSERLIFVSNKKIIEVLSSTLDNLQVEIIPFSKITKINECSKDLKLQILTSENDNAYSYNNLNSITQYYTLTYENLIHTIYTAHSKDFYFNFEVNKLN